MILITMAGLSRRFQDAGYKTPKYALELHGRTVFDWAVSSFEHYFKTDYFLFVIRPDDFAEQFIERAISDLGIRDYAICRLDEDTSGQAETAYRALKPYQNDFPVTIFNIDTFRFDFRHPDFIGDCDGYLEVFCGEGEHWSFVAPGPDKSVVKTTEKDRISSLCSDGLYYFKSQRTFCSVFEQSLKDNDRVRGEFYIAPLYNRFIQSGARIKYQMIDQNQVAFCGTPTEYHLLQKRPIP